MASHSVLHGKTSARRKTRGPVLAWLTTIGVLAVSPAESLASPLLHHAGDGHSAGTLPLVLTCLVLALVGLVSVRRRWRDAAMLSLAGLLSVLAVETAVHSVHHLDDPLAVQTCVVFGSSGHVDGACDTPPTVAGLTWTPYLSPVIDGDVLFALLWFRPDEGRAPPTVLSR
jgi:peptidoglycan/LPS O-acetylase OafA/YrhL